MAVKIIVDVFGCDNKPKEIISGAITAISENPDITILLSGDKDIIANELQSFSYNKEQIEIIDAKSVITNNDIPTTAIFEKKDSSLIKAINHLKENDDVIGMVSAGSTGAVLCASTILLGRLKNVTRPTLATVLPCENGKHVCLLDCGANVDCKKEMLVEFAYMGDSLMRSMYNIEKPRINLLSVGTEDKKGNELTKATFTLLKETSLNFIGNMEASDTLSGKYDVIVCDGFYGNILLKSIEGTAKFVLKKLNNSFLENSILDNSITKDILQKTMFEMDFNSRGGAIFLGVKKIIVKTHGASNSSTIYHAINQVYNLHNGHLIDNLKRNLL